MFVLCKIPEIINHEYMSITNIQFNVKCLLKEIMYVNNDIYQLSRQPCQHFPYNRLPA